jgi:hypothetical protein
MHRIIGIPARPYPARVALRPRNREDDQRHLQQQIENQDTFWKLRLRNRP